MRFDDFVKNGMTGNLPPPTARPAPESINELLPLENSSANFATLQQNLNNCLKIIDDEVMKGYLSTLDKLPIIAADEQRLASLRTCVHIQKVI